MRERQREREGEREREREGERKKERERERENNIRGNVNHSFLQITIPSGEYVQTRRLKCLKSCNV